MANLRKSLDKHPFTSSQPTLRQEKLDVASETEGIKRIIDTIETLNVQEVGTQVLGYLQCWLLC